MTTFKEKFIDVVCFPISKYIHILSKTKTLCYENEKYHFFPPANTLLGYISKPHAMLQDSLFKCICTRRTASNNHVI